MSGSSRRGHALERAREDAAAGRHLLAARRLRDRLRNVGYEPGTLAELGAVSLAMGDECAAGHAWLLSDAEGDHVDRAVARYVQACGGDVVAALEGAPETAKRCAVDDLAPAALRRVEALGFPLPLDRSRTLLRHAPSPRGDGGWSFRTVGCLVLIAVTALAAFVGIVTWALVGLRMLVSG